MSAILRLTQVTGHNMSLPEGITLKDDVMKRIAGFIDTKAEDILE